MNRSFIKTRPCPSQLGSGSCVNKSCTYAHSMEELKHMECNFGDKCTKKDTTCNFKHPAESVEEFRKRINFTEPVFFPSTLMEIDADQPHSSISKEQVQVSGVVLPPFVLDPNDPMSHVVASMALLMKRDVRWLTD